MARIIYVHGFLSSSKSKKAQDTLAWLRQHRPDIDYLCPNLPSYPSQAISALSEVLTQEPVESNYLIGSSLGGFWASYFVEQGFANKAVLINPAVSPQTRFLDLVGQELHHYYSDEVLCLREQDITALANCEGKEVTRPERQWLLAQTADEVLDYRLAEKRYHACRQTIEKGGNHSFENYARWLPDIIRFFDI